MYTKEEIGDINEAWFALERIVESDNKKESELKQALKYEAIYREFYSAKVLILREVLNCKKIKKGDLFSYSEGVMKSIVIAWSIFYYPITYSPYRFRYNKFKKLARKAVKYHDNAIERKLNASSSS